MRLEWSSISKLNSKSYICGYCNHPLASNQGYFLNDRETATTMACIYICHHCNKPTFFDSRNNQTPGIKFGEDVNSITDEFVQKLYDEARECTGSNSFTATVLCCRKLLMHISVSKGAEEKKQFIYYVKYLADNNYIPQDAKGWVDIIRNKGNEANHEIKIMEGKDAKDLLSFTTMLLKMVYEFPENVKQRQLSETNDDA